MSALPSPRTVIQARRELLINAIGLMDESQLDLLYREAGPYCLEVLLNATKPTETAPAAEPPPTPKPRQRRPTELTKAKSDALIAQLREAIGADGWTEAGLRAVFTGSGGHKTAKALISAKPGYRLNQAAAKAIEEFLK
ncbi:MAG: hypothetical protein K9L88_03380 [Chromatiaceae bacterium]|nr:hypothetical protein [Chromatiaceae bacterium]MCF8017721.1 hypothetical protein [Chromatiaceae bacterium]